MSGQNLTRFISCGSESEAIVSYRSFDGLSTYGLEILFRVNQDDSRKLSDLLNELQHRSDPEAAALKEKVLHRLNELERRPRHTKTMNVNVNSAMPNEAEPDVTKSDSRDAPLCPS